MKTRNCARIPIALFLTWLSCLASISNAAEGLEKSVVASATTDLVVIRYDATLIRLNGEMVNALFHEERLNGIRKSLKLESDVNLHIEFRPSEGHQPNGVLVGSLSSQFDTEIDRKKMVDTVVRTLRDALNDNLNSSFDGLSQQRAVVKENIQDAEKKLQKLYAEMQRFDQEKQIELQRESLQKLEARRLDKEIETRVSDQRRELLRRRLEEVQAELSKRVAVRDKLMRELQKTQQAFQESEVIAATKGKSDGRKATLQFEFETRKLNQEMQELAQVEEGIRSQLSRLAETYQKATMDMAIAKNEQQQLKELVERGRGSVSAIASNESVRQQLSRQIQHLESLLASLRKTESELRLQRDSLVPVQVRRWK